MKQDPATVKGTFVAVLDDRQFGPAETLIGNAIVCHQPTKWTRLTAWVHRKRTGIGGELKCRACGEVVGAGWGFWYHQAQAAIHTGAVPGQPGDRGPPVDKRMRACRRRRLSRL